jgi:hypothetical protein
MEPFRWLGAGLLWILAGVVGLLGAVLCVTVVLLPIGIPLLMLARRMVTTAGKLVIPRPVRHPVQELGDRSSKTTKRMAKGARGAAEKGRKKASDAVPTKSGKLRKKLPVPSRRKKLLGRFG